MCSILSFNFRFRPIFSVFIHYLVSMIAIHFPSYRLKSVPQMQKEDLKYWKFIRGKWNCPSLWICLLMPRTYLVCYFLRTIGGFVVLLKFCWYRILYDVSPALFSNLCCYVLWNGHLSIFFCSYLSSRYPFFPF